MNDRCGCCEGQGPEPLENRPGLDAIRYRVGTHATFLEAMKARLATIDVGDSKSAPDYPLRELKTASPDDPTIALLDAWATVADVLTFYQERIANEGYLRTVTERRSAIELARLVGYAPRPGVAASVSLAFSLQPSFDALIPAGTRAQSTPAGRELPQTFETSADVDARAAWNRMRPRLTERQRLDPDLLDTIYLAGLAVNLKAGDRILIDWGSRCTLHRVAKVEPDPVAQRTAVALIDWSPLKTTEEEESGVGTAIVEASPEESLRSARWPQKLDALASRMIASGRRRTLPPRSAADVPHKIAWSFGEGTQLGLRLFSLLRKGSATRMYEPLQRLGVREPQSVKVYALRVSAPLFGHNAPPMTTGIESNTQGSVTKTTTNTAEWPIDPAEQQTNMLFLDAPYERILPGAFVIVDAPGAPPSPSGAERDRKSSEGILTVYRAKHVEVRPRSAYGLSAKCTAIQLNSDWSSTAGLVSASSLADLRPVMVHTQSEELTLAEVPISENVEGIRIELDALYGGLPAGRWVIVSGERAGVPGLMESERVIISQVLLENRGGMPRTTIVFPNSLANSYLRETVSIYGNVVEATHGETRDEVLGSGDGSKPLQSFALKQVPLTYLSSPTPAGVRSTLEVRVDGLAWQETNRLSQLGPRSRSYLTRTGDDGVTTVIFGNGVSGTRPPTGVENITARYRSGIGKAGNVRAGQIAQLLTKPLGVMAVTNPAPATGGADPETRDQVRTNAPLGVRAFDRLVSVQDYADFARTFAGIGKAHAERGVWQGRPVVRLTIAGAGDALIADDAELYRNLSDALGRYGDAATEVVIERRDLVILVLSANIRIGREYTWERVERRVRSRLLDVFSFERREPGQNAALSEVVAVIQAVPGVVYVDVDTFGGVSENAPTEGGLAAGSTKPAMPSELAGQIRALAIRNADKGPDAWALPPRPPGAPAQLAYFLSAVPETLDLKEITA
jgi:predicted phage baseplate assembly protein